jgi:aarF domain-containing kinase
LIDYGQVKILNKEQRVKLARLIKAVAAHDDAATLVHFRALGFKSKYNNDEVALKLAKVYFDTNSIEQTEGKHIAKYLEDLQKLDPIVEQAQDFIMACRCGLLLRGFGDALNQRRSVAQEWLSFAETVLREAGEM